MIIWGLRIPSLVVGDRSSDVGRTMVSLLLAMTGG
jgi:hypothetical protein